MNRQQVIAAIAARIFQAANRQGQNCPMPICIRMVERTAAGLVSEADLTAAIGVDAVPIMIALIKKIPAR